MRYSRIDRLRHEVTELGEQVAEALLYHFPEACLGLFEALSRRFQEATVLTRIGLVFIVASASVGPIVAPEAWRRLQHWRSDQLLQTGRNHLEEQRPVQAHDAFSNAFLLNTQSLAAATALRDLERQRGFPSANHWAKVALQISNLSPEACIEAAEIALDDGQLHKAQWLLNLIDSPPEPFRNRFEATMIRSLELSGQTTAALERIRNLASTPESGIDSELQWLKLRLTDAYGTDDDRVRQLPEVQQFAKSDKRGLWLLALTHALPTNQRFTAFVHWCQHPDTDLENALEPADRLLRARVFDWETLAGPILEITEPEQRAQLAWWLFERSRFQNALDVLGSVEDLSSQRIASHAWAFSRLALRQPITDNEGRPMVPISLSRAVERLAIGVDQWIRNGQLTALEYDVAQALKWLQPEDRLVFQTVLPRIAIPSAMSQFLTAEARAPAQSGDAINRHVFLEYQLGNEGVLRQSVEALNITALSRPGSRLSWLTLYTNGTRISELIVGFMRAVRR